MNDPYCDVQGNIFFPLDRENDMHFSFSLTSLYIEQTRVKLFFSLHTTNPSLRKCTLYNRKMNKVWQSIYSNVFSLWLALSSLIILYFNILNFNFRDFTWCIERLYFKVGPSPLCCLLHWKTFKNDKKCVLFHLKSSEDI